VLDWDESFCNRVIDECRDRIDPHILPKDLMTPEGIQAFLDTVCSSEGSIKLTRFTRKNVAGLYGNRQCMPVLRACMKVLMNDDYRLFESLRTCR
ncbi:MAG: hypothetical protein J5673_01130, partial [Candidatus Methanomethylophilaceae archaeon]|nr:hypothetical protein [Candidatus Methanomethylophilaceae archaeon]